MTACERATAGLEAAVMVEVDVVPEDQRILEPGCPVWAGRRADPVAVAGDVTAGDRTHPAVAADRRTTERVQGAVLDLDRQCRRDLKIQRQGQGRVQMDAAKGFGNIHFAVQPPITRNWYLEYV